MRVFTNFCRIFSLAIEINMYKVLSVLMQKMMSILARRGFKHTLDRATRMIDGSPSILQEKTNFKVSKNRAVLSF